MVETEMTPDGLQITVSGEADPEMAEFVHQRIKAFNDAHSEAHRLARAEGLHPLLVIARGEGDHVAGGLVASTYWDWLDVDHLWVAEEMRGRALGRRLLRTAEREARARGCFRAKLTTYSFQARKFYEKEGYRVVGVLEDYPPGGAYYWMRKDFADSTQ